MTGTSSARKTLTFAIEGFRLIVPSLFAFAALLLTLAPAQAETTLVSNLFQEGSVFASYRLPDNVKIGQKFTTGNEGANLTSVDIYQSHWTSYSAYMTVKLHEASSNYNVAGEEIATLKNPWKFTGCGPRTFTLPLDQPAVLAPNTTYMIVLEAYTTVGHANITLRVTNDDSEVSGGLAGWTVADERIINVDSATPSTRSHALRMAIKGYTGVNYLPNVDEDGIEASVPTPPTRHEGPGKSFYFDFHLTQRAIISWVEIQDHTFTITGGQGAYARRVDKRDTSFCNSGKSLSNHWLVGVLPDGNGPVTVTLEAKRTCDDAGAICNSDRKRITNTISFTVNGPEALNQNDENTRNDQDTSGPSISVGDTSAIESDSYIKFPVKLSQKFPNHLVFFDVTPEGETAKPNIDYWAFGSTFTIDENKTRLNVSIPLRDDSKQEGNETFRIRLSNARKVPLNASDTDSGTPIHIGDGEATGTIIDDEGPSISVGDTSAIESDSYIKFPVRLSQKFPNHMVSFDVTPEGGTAKPNIDYWAFGSTSFTIDQNKTRLNVSIPLRDDSRQEGDETFRIKLSNARLSAVSTPNGAMDPGTPLYIEDGEATGTIIDDDPSGNKQISIVPNPFNPSTHINYRLDQPGVVKLMIYNILGQPIRTLVDEAQVAGKYRVLWDSRDDEGNAVASGIYLARLIYPGKVHTQRLLLLK